MKTNATSGKSTHSIPLVGAAALAGGLLLAGAATLPAEPLSDSGFLDQMKSWQSKMSDIFRDSWKDVRKSATPGVSNASVDLREQHDGYMLRVSLPGRDVDKVDVALVGETLRVTAPASGTAGRYEQSLVLPGAIATEPPKIERVAKDSMIVVTVPKKAGALAKAGSFPTVPKPTALLSDWDRDVLDHMSRMRREMDEMFEGSFKDFRAQPSHNGFFDLPSFGSSTDVKDDGANYVVSAFLPGRDNSDVKVTVEGATLRIEAKAEERSDAEHAKAARVAQYSQLLTLPGPVVADKMKVENKDGMITITLPKA